MKTLQESFLWLFSKWIFSVVWLCIASKIVGRDVRMYGISRSTGDYDFLIGLEVIFVYGLVSLVLTIITLTMLAIANSILLGLNEFFRHRLTNNS